MRRRVKDYKAARAGCSVVIAIGSSKRREDRRPMASGHSTVTPACNKLLQKKWDDKTFQSHRSRLMAARSQTDSGAPREFLHIRQNLRKIREQEDRQATINRHNTQLLSRMHTIMNTTGRVDHRNMDWRPKKSLNYMKRQNEVDRVTRENFALVVRLQSIKPQYNAKSWEGEFKTHQHRSKAISTFPPLHVHRTSKAPSRRLSVETKEELKLPQIAERNSPEATRPTTEHSDIQEEIEV